MTALIASAEAAEQPLQRPERVVVYGVTTVSVTAARRLGSLGIDTIVIRNPALDSQDVAQGTNTVVIMDDHEPVPDPDALLGTCEAGLSDELLRLSREAIEAGIPFLPVWLDGLAGHVGPLYLPRQSACLRCYTMRRASNDPHHAVSEAVRLYRTSGPSSYQRSGRMPYPMLAVLGEISVLQFLAPPDRRPWAAANLSVEVDLVTFGMRRHPVLPVPDCPDCGPGRAAGEAPR